MGAQTIAGVFSSIFFNPWFRVGLACHEYVNVCLYDTVEGKSPKLFEHPPSRYSMLPGGRGNSKYDAAVRSPIGHAVVRVHMYDIIYRIIYAAAVKPPIFPTSKIPNPLVIPVFAESRHLKYMGNPSEKSRPLIVYNSRTFCGP